jgi:isopenicillin-N epimerase
VPTALEVVGTFVDGGWPAVMARNHELAIDAGTSLAVVTGSWLSPESMIGSMVALSLPAEGPLAGSAAEGQSSPLDTDPLQTAIYDRFAIEVPIGPFPVPAAESADRPRRLIRVSAALHNDRDDIDRLVEAFRTIAGGN